MAVPFAIKDKIQQFKKLQGERAPLNRIWEELAEVLAPERRGFLTGEPPTDLRATKVFDTNPMVAKRGIVNAVGAMLRPKTSAPGKWYDIVTEDDELMEDREVKAWIDHAEERMWKAIYNPRAHFITATGEVDDDLVTFGTGAIWTGVRRDRSGLFYRGFHLKNVYVCLDGEGEVSEVYLVEMLTGTQAANRWGIGNLSTELQRLMREDNKAQRDKKHEFVWCIGKRDSYDPRDKRNVNFPIYSTVLEIEREHKVMEEGFKEWPIAISRWDTRSGEPYGRSPGILALPDVQTLQAMGKTMLRGLHRAVDPTWLLPSDSMVAAPNFNPGKVAYYDAKAIRTLGLTDPFRQMDNKARLDWGLEAQGAYREQVQAIFFKNILNLPVAGPDMTATEVLERKEEFIREIGAVFGRLESDYSGPVIERTFNLMQRNNGFRPPPEVLQGHNVLFRFASPIEKAKRQIEESVVAMGIDRILKIETVHPEVGDVVDWGEFGKYLAESHDFPPKLITDARAAQARAQARAQAQAQEEQAQDIERTVAGSAQVAGALKDMRAAA